MSKKTIIIKIGTNVITTSRNEVNTSRLKEIAKQIRILQQRSFNIVLVVSGAISTGLATTKLGPKPDALAKQMAAGVGQAKLFSQLWTILKQKKIQASQLLLTREDFLDKKRRDKIKKIIEKALRLNIVPVLNENDVLSLYSFGGNDFLAEKITRLLPASQLIILTDVDGLLDLKPESTKKDLTHAKVITEVKQATAELEQKVIPLSSGKSKDILTRLLINKEKIGTHFITGKKN